MRYVGQNFELAVPIAAGTTLSLDLMFDAAGLRKRFFDVHETAYGYHNPHDAVEIVNYRLTAHGRLYRFETKKDTLNGAAPPEPIGTRPVYFSPDTAVESKVYERSALRTGQTIEGPAIIEQVNTTVLVPGGWRLDCDPVGSFALERV